MMLFARRVRSHRVQPLVLASIVVFALGAMAGAAEIDAVAFTTDFATTRGGSTGTDFSSASRFRRRRPSMPPRGRFSPTTPEVRSSMSFCMGSGSSRVTSTMPITCSTLGRAMRLLCRPSAAMAYACLVRRQQSGRCARRDSHFRQGRLARSVPPGRRKFRNTGQYGHGHHLPGSVLRSDDAGAARRMCAPL